MARNGPTWCNNYGKPWPRPPSRPRCPPKNRFMSRPRCILLPSSPEVLVYVNSGGPPISSLSHLRSPAVLFVADLFHPVHDLAVESFLNRDVRHGCCRCCAMPMFQSWWEPHHVAGTDFLNRSALSLRPAATACDNERLT